MELIIKVGECEMPIEEAVVTRTDFGTSCYGFKFDENVPTWEKYRNVNEAYLKCQESYLNNLLRFRGYLFLNDVYDVLGIARTALGQCVGWIFDPNDPTRHNHVDLGVWNDRNKGEKNEFILDPNADGYILDRL